MNSKSDMKTETIEMAIRTSLMTAMLTTLVVISNPAHAQCAMGNENPWVTSTTPVSAFQEQTDGTVLHRPTGRIWQRCALGQSWDGTSCTGTPQLLSWSAALAEAQSHQQAGFEDWRVPDRNELASIIEARCFVPSVNDIVFPLTATVPYWTGSPVFDATDQAWVVDFADGLVQPSATSTQHAVRLVRERME